MKTKQQGKNLLSDARVKSVFTFALSVFIFLALSWIYFYPNDLNGDVMRQGDVVSGTAIGQEVALYRQQTGEVSRWTNALFGGMPTFQISPSYESSDMLEWVNKVYSLQILGMPDYVSWLFMLMLGFFILMLAFKMEWYYAVLGAVGYALSSYFIIIMGAGHIWKVLTLAYIPPTIAGIVWCYRGKWLGGAALTAVFAALQLHSNHVQMTYYSAMLIVALSVAYLFVAIKNKKIGGWAMATCALAVAGGLALAANAPNLYLSNKYAKETMRGGHSELTSLKPTDGEKPKAPETGGLDRNYINQWSYGKSETFTLLVPNVKGGASVKPTKSPVDPSQIVTLGVTLDQTSKAQDMQNSMEMGPEAQYLSQFPQYFGDQPLTNGPVYVGALIFALFILGCIVVKGPVKWALLAVTVLAVMLSWGGNFTGFTDWFVYHFPLYNKFRAPASILIVVEITMPLLGVLGLYEVFSQENAWNKYRNALFIAFGGSAALCLLFALIPSMFDAFSAQEYDALIKTGQFQKMPQLQQAVETIRYALVSADAWRSFLVIAVGFCIIVLFLRRYKGNVALLPTLLVAAVVVVDMFMIDKRYVDSESFISKSDIPEVKFIPSAADKQILKDTTNYRVLDPANFSSAEPSYYHKMLGGYHPAKLTRYNDMIERQFTKEGKLNLGEVTVSDDGKLQGLRSVWNMLNTKYVVNDKTTAMVNADALGNAWFVDTLAYVQNADEEMKFLDDFDAAKVAVADKKFQSQLGRAIAKSPGDTIYETGYRPNKLSYHSHSAKGGLAVFSEVYFPWGWKATIDGKEVAIGRVNYILRALQVPAGDHDIEFSFNPEEVEKTDGIAKIAIFAIFALVIAAFVWTEIKRRKGNKNEEESTSVDVAETEKK